MIKESKYINRIIDKEIENKLKIFGAISIRGPKWCGKTTTASQFTKSTFKVQGDESHPNNTELAKENPYFILKGEKPRLIDEWQLVPKIWNAVRNNVDASNESGEYILTGSATPNEKEANNLHSGAGRFTFVDMKPMTLYESGDSNGKISLRDLFNGKKDIDGITCDMTYEKMAYLICRGGWPSTIKMSKETSTETAKNYIEAVVSSDISRIDGISRNPKLARLILKSYARLDSTIESNQTLIEDVQANFGTVSNTTILDYLNQLKKLYIINEIDAWSPNIRSKSAIRTSPKKSFVDPSLAVAALNCTEEDIEYDIRTYGLLFENLVDRDLSVYIQANDGYLCHYRDKYGLEIDQILRLNNDKYALVETKIGEEKVSNAEEHLLKLQDLILTNQPKLGKPEFLMIVTNTQEARITEKGVLVVPIACLKD